MSIQIPMEYYFHVYHGYCSVSILVHMRGFRQFRPNLLHLLIEPERRWTSLKDLQ